MAYVRWSTKLAHGKDSEFYIYWNATPATRPLMEELVCMRFGTDQKQVLLHPAVVKMAKTGSYADIHGYMETDNINKAAIVKALHDWLHDVEERYDEKAQKRAAKRRRKMQRAKA